MSEQRIRIDAETAEELAIHIMTYANEVITDTTKFKAYYESQNSECWRDSKAVLFEEHLINIIRHSNQASDVFYEYGERLYDKVQKLRS